MLLQKRVIQLLLCLSLFGSPLLAQMEMGMPAEMKNLSPMEGSWAGTFDYRMDPSAEWLSAEGKMKIESILSGCAQRTHFAGLMMGQQFEGQATRSYNRYTKKYQSYWVDNMGAHQVYSQGEFKDGKLVLEGKSAMGAMVFLTRETVAPVDENVMNWQMEFSMDDGATWFVAMKATYKKQ